MFIANSKRTFAEVRGLNSPAGATMAPAVPLSPLTIRKIPLTRRQSRAGGKCSYGGLSVLPACDCEDRCVIDVAVLVVKSPAPQQHDGIQCRRGCCAESGLRSP